MEAPTEPIAEGPPTRRRRVRWLLIIVLAVTGTGVGGWLWRGRLNSEERFLVGHWHGTLTTVDGFESRVDWDFQASRRVYSNQAWWSWNAHAGEFSAREIRRSSFWALCDFLIRGAPWPTENIPVVAEWEQLGPDRVRMTLSNPDDESQGGTILLQRGPRPSEVTADTQ